MMELEPFEPSMAMNYYERSPIVSPAHPNPVLIVFAIVPMSPRPLGSQKPAVTPQDNTNTASPFILDPLNNYNGIVVPRNRVLHSYPNLTTFKLSETHDLRSIRRGTL